MAYYYVNETQVGYSSFWHCDWKSAHYDGVKSNCGTCTIINKRNYENLFLPYDNKKKLGYICNVIITWSHKEYLTEEGDEREIYNFSLEID